MVQIPNLPTDRNPPKHYPPDSKMIPFFFLEEHTATNFTKKIRNYIYGGAPGEDMWGQKSNFYKL